MKPTSEWKFSSKAADIDLNRILRESGEKRDVLRLTVGGQEYTLCSRRTAANHALLHQALGVLGSETKFSNVHGGALIITGLISVFAPAERWYESGHNDVVIFKGDFAGKLVRRVETKVEVF